MEEKWKMVCEFAKMRHPVCDVNGKKNGIWKEKMTSFSEEIFERRTLCIWHVCARKLELFLANKNLKDKTKQKNNLQKGRKK